MKLRIPKTSIIAALALFAIAAADLSSAKPKRGIAKNDRKPSAAEVEKRRIAFEEAMKKIEEAEIKQAKDKAAQAERAEAAKAAQVALRESVAAEAAADGAGVNREADLKRVSAQAFAVGIAAKTQPVVPAVKVPPSVPPVKVPPAKVPPTKVPPTKVPPTKVPLIVPPVQGAPKGGVPVEGHGPAPGLDPKPVVSPGEEEPRAETVIDADGRAIFDGSGRFGPDYQVVIFEDNVRVTNPEFIMTSDRLTAYFKQPEKKPLKPGEVPSASEEPADEGKKLERAVATGREVTVRKTIEGGDDQIAKARKATYFADRNEVMLEIWPQVQRGKNLVIAKSKDTVIVLKGEEMIVNGPVRTEIVGKGMTKPADPKAGAGTADSGKTSSVKKTVIDAELGAVFNRPSARSGEKEVFFEGKVGISEPGFGISGDDLTAYMRPDPKTGETVMRMAVVRGRKAEVEQGTGDARRVGRANRIVYITATGDVRLEDQPEVFRGGEWIKGGAVVVMNKDTKNFRQLGGDERSRMSFAPGERPPG
jgi:lipopolysaccharide export system protein LptA